MLRPRFEMLEDHPIIIFGLLGSPTKPNNVQAHLRLSDSFGREMLKLNPEKQANY